MPLLGEVLLKKLCNKTVTDYKDKSTVKSYLLGWTGYFDVELAKEKRDRFDIFLEKFNAAVDELAEDKALMVKQDKKPARASRRSKARTSDEEDVAADVDEAPKGLMDLKQMWKERLTGIIDDSLSEISKKAEEVKGNAKAEHQTFLTKLRFQTIYCLDILFDHKFKSIDEDLDLSLFFLPDEDGKLDEKLNGALRETFGKTLPQQQKYVGKLVGMMMEPICHYAIDKTWALNNSDSLGNYIRNSMMNPTREVGQDKLKQVTPSIIEGLLAKMKLYNNQATVFEQIPFLDDMLSIMKGGASDSTDARKGHQGFFEVPVMISFVKLAGGLMWGDGELDKKIAEIKTEIGQYLQELRVDNSAAIQL